MDRLTAPRPASIDAPVNKWHVLRDLGTARERLGLSDRDLTVLQALLTFHPATELEPGSRPVVFPSNASICDRLNGMPCSTMRRHLSRLIDAGLLVRRDSPNGKRYSRRVAGQKIAYGFDLSPLCLRAAEIAQLADDVTREAEQARALRDTLSLMRRDLETLAAYGNSESPGEIWEAYVDLARLTARTLRRKLSLAQLEEIEVRLRGALGDLKAEIGLIETPDLSTSDARNEQHYQSSDKDFFEPEEETAVEPERLSLREVTAVCPEVQTFSAQRISDWSDLVTASSAIAPMMGICKETLEEAGRKMGVVQASVVVAAMLERFGDIRSPGAYLRSLSRKAETGEFSVLPMVKALERRVA